MVVQPPKIGVLDSGIGGLSVLREIHRLLPQHPTLYFADQTHLPYGPRAASEVQQFTESISKFLMIQGAVVVVIACNTASAASLHYLRDKYPNIPFVGMEPAVKPAVEHTKSRVVGVLSTRTTAEGVLYQRVLERYAGDVKIITQVAPRLVEISEAQNQNMPESRAVIAEYLKPLIEAGADEIVLACTHFPFLAEIIQAIVGAEVQLIDPSPAIARQTARVWPNVTLLPAANRYFTSGQAEGFQAKLKQLIGIQTSVEVITWQDGQIILAT